MPATSRTRPDRDRSERRGCTCFARPSTPSARWPSWPWPWAQASSPRNSQAIHERGPRAAGSPSPQRSRGLRCWQDRALGQGVRSRSRDTLALLLTQPGVSIGGGDELTLPGSSRCNSRNLHGLLLLSTLAREPSRGKVAFARRCLTFTGREDHAERHHRCGDGLRHAVYRGFGRLGR